MSGDWRERARARVGSKVEARMQELAESEPLSSDAFDTEMRRNKLEAFRSLDPQARLNEELTIRLNGEAILEGLLLPDTADPIMRNLQAMINSVSDTEVKLGLAGISRGSTVLHLCPVYPEQAQISSEDATAEDDAEIPVLQEVVESPVEVAMRELIRLVDAAETGEALDAAPGMLAPFEALVSALDKRGIDVDLGWYGETGTVRTGKLTAEGRMHAQRSMRPEYKRSIATLTGYVSQLSAPSRGGEIMLKTSMSKERGTKIEITIDELLGLGLKLGEYIEIRVNVEEKRDPLTKKVKTTRSYQELLKRRQ